MSSNNNYEEFSKKKMRRARTSGGYENQWQDTIRYGCPHRNHSVVFSELIGAEKQFYNRFKSAICKKTGKREGRRREGEGEVQVETEGKKKRKIYMGKRRVKDGGYNQEKGAHRR